MEKIFIQHLCELADKSPSALAVASGLSTTTLTRHTTDNVEVNHKLSITSLRKIANYLGVSVDKLVLHRELVAESLKNSQKIPNLQPQIESGLTRMQPRARTDSEFGPKMVSILGHANGSREALILNFDEPIGEAPQHPHQKGVKNGFALYTKGESMSPRYTPGELVYAIGNRQPLPNQDCIVELKNGEGYVKQFVRLTEKELICRQFNPEKEWKRPASEIKAIHAIVGRG